MSAKRTLSPSRPAVRANSPLRRNSPAKSQQKKTSQKSDNAKKEQADSMLSDLTDEELLELFRVVDSDGGGTISRDELKEVMVSSISLSPMCISFVYRFIR